MDLTHTNERAVNQVMSVFTNQQQQEFKHWLAEQEDTDSPFSGLIFGHPYYVISLDKNLADNDNVLSNIPNKPRRAIDDLRESYSSNKTSYYISSFLIFVLDQQRRGSEATLIILPESILSSLLNGKYAPEHFTPSEVRVLAQLISDPEIKHAASKDDVMVSTKETHYKSAARKIGGRKRIGVIADLTALLLLEITVASRPHQQSSERIFHEYREKYLPSIIKIITLMAPLGVMHRFLDMGPKSGKIVIALHPMILPDFRDQDVELLYKLNLRIIWPLRHGFLDPHAKPLSVEEQLQDSITSIELARDYYCDEPFILASMITSAWYGIRYAEQYPENIKALLFAGACYNKSKKVKRVRQFGEGLIALASNSQNTTNIVLAFAEKHFFQHKKFRSLLDKIYSDSQSDLRILDEEMSRPGFEGRYFFALKNSFRSLRHDLLHQADMGWNKLSQISTLKHFVHGDDNAIHSIDELANLVRTAPKSRLHTLKNCGQLMYYEHFKSLARIASKI